MSNRPLVSVIIPTYNRIQKISGAINSVLKQTYTNVQLIVVDDGSDDNTPELMKSFPTVEYIIQPHAGQATARNTGLAHAKGSIIASLDSDDMWEPDFLERSVTVLEEKKADFVFANWHQQLNNGQWSDCLSNDPFLKPYIKETENHWIDLPNADLRNLFLRTCPAPSSAAVIRKSSVYAGWNILMKIGDDWCLYLDMIFFNGCKAAFTMDKLWHKQIDSLNIYDGRKRSEVLLLLFIDDFVKYMQRYENCLTREELQVMQEKYMQSLVELAKHRLVRDFNITGSAKLIKRAMDISPSFTFSAIPQVIKSGWEHHIKEIMQKFTSK
jgi:glycosyltransferase involved in cell wall biosynthesis